MDTANLRLLDDAAVSALGKTMREDLLQNYSRMVADRTGQLRRAIQQGVVTITQQDGAISLAFTPATLPGLPRPGERSSAPRPNTSVYGSIVFQGRGPIVTQGSPMVFFGRQGMVFTHRVGPADPRPVFDFTPEQQAPLVTELGTGMVNAIAERFANGFK